MYCQCYTAHLAQSIGAQHDYDMRLEESNLDVGFYTEYATSFLIENKGPLEYWSRT